MTLVSSEVAQVPPGNCLYIHALQNIQGPLASLKLTVHQVYSLSTFFAVNYTEIFGEKLEQIFIFTLLLVIGTVLVQIVQSK